jgi:hypothetical protein
MQLIENLNILGINKSSLDGYQFTWLVTHDPSTGAAYEDYSLVCRVLPPQV